MNQKQIDAKVAELMKLAAAKKTQKEAEALQIRKSRNDTHSKIKDLEREMKAAETSGEVDSYIKVAGDLNNANAFLKILEAREADLYKPTEKDLQTVEGFKTDVQDIRGALVLEAVEKLQRITEEILKIFEEADTPLDTAKAAATMYAESCGTEAMQNIVIPSAKATTWLQNFYAAATRFKEGQARPDFKQMLGIPEEKE